MTRVFFILLITIVLLALEIFLAYRQNKWAGLILPAIFFIAISLFLMFNVAAAFTTIEGFGSFLQSFGTKGMWALVLKIGFAYTPVIVNLILYFICRAIYNAKHPDSSSKELKKMMANDL